MFCIQSKHTFKGWVTVPEIEKHWGTAKAVNCVEMKHIKVKHFRFVIVSNFVLYYGKDKMFVVFN